MNKSEALNAAADLIEQKGWIQGEYKSENGFCLIGALDEVIWNGEIIRNSQMASLESSATSALRDRVPQPNLVAWNDEPGRTKQEVVDLLRKAARDE